VAETLVGKKLTAEAIEATAELAAKVSRPVDNADMDVWYRKQMTKVYVVKALTSISDPAASKGL
jgi:CO/xanthine dehydrogenase FAD-binding subunit